MKQDVGKLKRSEGKVKDKDWICVQLFKCPQISEKGEHHQQWFYLASSFISRPENNSTVPKKW